MSRNHAIVAVILMLISFLGALNELTMTARAGEWVLQGSGVSDYLEAVDFVKVGNAYYGWVVGVNGIILNTSDGGDNWYTQVSSVSVELRGVDFVDENNGWAVGASGTILHTIDGGETWNRQTTGTTDDLWDVVCLNIDNCWAVGINSTGKGLVLKTTDGGNNWDSTLVGEPGNELHGVDFFNLDFGWVVGLPSLGYEIFVTTDGGTTWIPKSAPTIAQLEAVDFSGGANGWAVGLNGVILRTSNAGNSWTAQDSGLTSHIEGVSFISSSEGWAVATDGSIVHTTNSGDLWTLETSTSDGLWAVHMMDSHNGWAVGDNGAIYRYRNRVPTLTLPSVTPSVGNSSTMFTYEVVYTDLDNDAPIQSYVYVDGNPATMFSSDTIYTDGSLFTHSTTLSDGNHEYYLLFDDGFGGMCRLPLVGTYSGPLVDSEPPPASTISSSTHPSEASWYNNNDPAFEWTEPADTSGIVGYSYVLDQSPLTIPDTTSEGTSTSKTYIDYSDGTWYFHVRAKDGAGNWGETDHYTINMDITTPQSPAISSSTHPSETSWYNNNDPSFIWTEPSDTSGVIGYSYILDQNPSTIPDTTSEGTSTSKTYIDYSDGTWYFHVRAKDGAGNWGETDHHTINMDITKPQPPTISSSTHPSEASWYNNNDPAFEWIEPSDTSGIIGYSYILDQNPSTIPDTTSEGTSTSKTYIDYSDGTWYFHVRAKDGAGNWGQTNHYTVNIDTTAPSSPTAIGATPSGWTNANTFVVGWSNPLDLSGIAGAFYKIDSPPSHDTDGTFVAGIETNQIANIQVPSEGEHQIHIWLRDLAGNVDADNRGVAYLHYDATAPGPPLGISVNPSNWSSTNSFAVSWVNPSDVSGIEGVYYKTGAIPTAPLDGTYSSLGITPQITGISAPEIGSHVVYFWLRDGAGNVDHANRGVATLYYKGTEATATVTSTSPAGSNNAPVTSTVTITFSRSMNRSSVETAFLITPEVTGSFTWNENNDTMIFLPSSKLGFETTYTYSISGEAKDSFGRELDRAYVWTFTTEKEVTIWDAIVKEIVPATATALLIGFLGWLSFELWRKRQKGKEDKKTTKEPISKEEKIGKDEERIDNHPKEDSVLQEELEEVAPEENSPTSENKQED